MKRTAAVVFLMLACAACAGTMDWRYGKPGRVVVTNEEDAAALSAISALTTQSFARVHDSAQPSRYFMGIENGIGTVYEVTGPFTNLTVTLSDDFEETVTHTRPAWTNNVFPFTEGQWVGGVSENTEGNADYYYIESSAGTTVAWSDTTETLPASLTLVFGDGAGTATVSVGNIYYTTNAIKHFSTEAELEAAKAACGVVLTNTVNEAVSNLTADITSATNALMPYTRTLYGDVSTTNETGYAAFNATNAAVASYSALIPSSAVGSFTNIFRYNFNGVRKFGTLTNTAWFLKSGFGAGYKAVSTVVSIKDAAGNVLASSASQPVNIDQTVTTQAAITNTLAIPLNIYSGTVEIACIAVSTNTSFSVRLYSGAQYTNLLTFSEAPVPYATYAELTGHLSATDPHPGKYVKLTDGTATNIAIVGGNVSGDPLIGANAVTQYVAQSIAAPYTAWTGTVTPADGTATVAIAHGNMPVLVADAPCVLTLDPTGYGTAGVSRVSLSYYPGTNSFTFATNVISYAETPTVDTNGWNTLLIRRVSDGAWKGVGL